MSFSLLQEMYGSHHVLIPKAAGPRPGDYPRSLLGQQVRVVLNRNEESDAPAVVTEGQLLGFGQGGDFEILEDDGCIHYCWPMLRIEPRHG